MNTVSKAVLICEFSCFRDLNCHLSISFKVFTTNKNRIAEFRDKICKKTYTVLVC